MLPNPSLNTTHALILSEEWRNEQTAGQKWSEDRWSAHWFDDGGWMRCWRLNGEVRQQCSNFGRGEQPENERLDAPPGKPGQCGYKDTIWRSTYLWLTELNRADVRKGGTRHKDQKRQGGKLCHSTWSPQTRPSVIVTNHSFRWIDIIHATQHCGLGLGGNGQSNRNKGEWRTPTWTWMLVGSFCWPIFTHTIFQ